MLDLKLATHKLIFINTIVYLITIVIPDFIYQYFALYPFESQKFSTIQLVTCQFIHDTRPSHIVFNMLILYIFSIDLEKLFGPKKIIEFYLISGVLAALFHNITLNSNLIALASLLDKDLTMVGASGSVWGIMTIYAFTFPDRSINLFFLPISIKVKSLILFFLFVEIFSAITPSISDQTSHFAHIGGAVAGGLIHFLYNKKGLG